MFTKAPTIVVADDDPSICEKLAELLAGIGYVVYSVDNSEDAVALCSQAVIDVVILDLNMPRLNGLEVLAKLKTSSSTSSIQVILYTASRNFCHPDMPIKGVADIVVKSATSTATILDSVRRLVLVA